MVLNVHHYDEIYERPDDHAARLVGIWKQIATEFRDAPETVYFELLNEPHSALSDERWNALFPQILREVRALHPQRPVIVGPSQWNSHANLQNMKLPADDRNLIVTFHYYLPFEFTHQQAEWLGKDAPPAHRPFPAKESEVDMIELHFERAAKWAKEQQRPLYLGEFGAYHKADLPARVAWTKLVRKTAEEHGIDWAYWNSVRALARTIPNATHGFPNYVMR